MNSSASSRTILWASFVIGSASIINILVGLIKTKIAAVLLGPAGIGIIGIFQNLLNTASIFAGLGIGNVGTRQIAQAKEEKNSEIFEATRLALMKGSLILAVIGSFVFWIFRDELATYVLNSSQLSSSVGWLSIAVGLSILVSAQTALLNGLRRISDLAQVSVISALTSATFGVAALYLWKDKALVAFIAIAPLCSLVVGWIYISCLPKANVRSKISLLVVFKQWKAMSKLGIAFMLATLFATVAQLFVRSNIQEQLGVNSLGLYQASWQISMTYLGFVLSAMGTDYYPRLTGAISDNNLTNKMVSHQTEISLLLATPVLLAILFICPWIIATLYSAEFAKASKILEWQILGDALKIVSWPLGFVLLAKGDGRAFMGTEAAAYGAYALLVWIGLPVLGINATGVAFVGMYAVYLPAIYYVVKARTGFRWSKNLKLLICASFLSCALAKILIQYIPDASLLTGCLFVAIWFSYSIFRILQMSDGSGRIIEILKKFLNSASRCHTLFSRK